MLARATIQRAASSEHGGTLRIAASYRESEGYQREQSTQLRAADRRQCGRPESCRCGGAPASLLRQPKPHQKLPLLCDILVQTFGECGGIGIVVGALVQAFG